MECSSFISIGMRKLPDEKQLRRERVDNSEPIVTEQKLRTVASHPSSATAKKVYLCRLLPLIYSPVLCHSGPLLRKPIVGSLPNQLTIKSIPAPPPPDKSDKGTQVQFPPQVFLICGKLTFKTNLHKRLSVERKQPDTAGHTKHLSSVLRTWSVPCMGWRGGWRSGKEFGCEGTPMVRIWA